MINKVRKLFITAFGLALLVGVLPAHANMITFDLNNATDGGGDPASATVTLDDSTANSIIADVVVNQPPIADIRGIFFDIADGTGLSLGDISGADITDSGTDIGSGSGLGGGANTGPPGANGDFDFGLEIGTSGMSTDDIQSTQITFDTTGNSLTLDSFEAFLVRLTSVEAGSGNRNGSSRVVGDTPTTPPVEPPVDVPAPGSIMLLVMGLVLVGTAKLKGGRRRASKTLSTAV